MKEPRRGEVWLVDLGFVGKVRPCLVLNTLLQADDRAIVTVVTHTTSTRGSRFEVKTQTRFLEEGAFDCQSLVTIPIARLIRKLGALLPNRLAEVENFIRSWLEL